MRFPIFQFSVRLEVKFGNYHKKLTWSGLRNRHGKKNPKAGQITSSSSQQQIESFSVVDTQTSLQSLETTACVLVNETLSSSETGKGEQFICPRCEDINLPDLFSSQNPPRHLPLQHRGKFDLDPECGICRLLILSWLYPPYLRPGDPRKPVVSLGLWHERTRCLFISGINEHGGMIQEVPSAAINNFMAAKIDFTILKSWIEDCSHNHGPECAATWNRDSISGLKLINIKEKRIVNASQEGGPYAALSYVWGTGPQGSPQGDKLPTEMPKTIVDAMNVALELDLEYLWVDRYCIQQGDPEEKNDQISKMHHIYRQSHVTIIAAAGNGPNHGIPGMSIPRAPQPYTVLKGRVFIAFREHGLGADLPNSKWHTRAWTYQEGLLSRRIIYFTDSQSFFHCNQEQNPPTFAIEDPIRNVVKPYNGRIPCDLARRLEHNRKCGHGNNFNDALIGEHIREINLRNLTYESDRVNAVAGIMGRWKDQSVIAGHLSGIPVLRERFYKRPRTIMSWEEGFLSGIAALEGFKQGSRREEFPSWSWAGWKNVEYYNRIFLREYNIRIWIELDTTATSILSSATRVPKPLVSNPDCSSICLSSREYQKIAQRLIFKDSTCRFIRIEAPIVHCQLKRLRNLSLTVDLVEGCQVDEKGSYEELDRFQRKVHFLSQVDHGSNQERELLSSPLKGLLMVGEYRGDHKGLMIFVKKLDDYFEMLGSCWVCPEWLPVFLQVRDEEGSIRPLFEYLPEEKPETEILLRKEIVRLG